MPAIIEPADWTRLIGKEAATLDELKVMPKTKEGVKMRRDYRGKAIVREPTGMLF